MARTKFVTIESPGKIGVLGGILGPIKTPFYLDIATIITLINAGKKVYEVNPTDVKDKTLLTRHNALHEIYSNTPKKSEVKPVVSNTTHTKASASQVSTSIHTDGTTAGIGIDLFQSNKYI